METPWFARADFRDAQWEENQPVSTVQDMVEHA
jgi:hypothetical protein